MDFSRGANIDLYTASKLLGKVTDEDAHRGPGCDSEQRRDSDTDAVHAENPGEDDADAQPEPQAQPDRVPGTHLEASLDRCR